MSNVDGETEVPVPMQEIVTPKPKRVRTKKKAPVEPAKKPRKRKPAAKKKAKANRPAKAKRKAAKPTKRGKAKTKTRKSKRKNAKANVRNKLYKMLKAKLPKKFKTSEGEIDFKKFIKGLRMTPEGVYKWFRGDHMAARNAMPIVRLTKSRVKPVDLIPFVF